MDVDVDVDVDSGRGLGKTKSSEWGNCHPKYFQGLSGFKSLIVGEDAGKRPQLRLRVYDDGTGGRVQTQSVQVSKSPHAPSRMQRGATRAAVANWPLVIRPFQKGSVQRVPARDRRSGVRVCAVLTVQGVERTPYSVL